ncbi:MAG: insulinase family protein [Clostridia bacterium]|nr:insulinase family protein [Clostridia bacterium]
MQVIENLKVKEKVYVEKLENGLTIMIIPKKGIQKKYVIWGTKYGSNDSKFVVPGEEQETEVPKGVAHFLEHKMFEQENGVNSLDALTSLGVEANAYTTNDHTAYLFECTENFYPALDELMDYVQNPYFTEENVEKEKGIIGQEIMMYDDYPEWRVYLNALEAMYHEHPVKLDITGTIETISHIDKDILYKCYNTFYNPSNMAMVICGDFEPESLLEEIKKRLIDKKANGEIKRIYPEEAKEVVQEKIEQFMDVSQPLFTIGIKDKETETKERVKKHIAIEILLNMIIGKSSKLYQELYNDGVLFVAPGLDYEYAKGYAHLLITGQSPNPEEVFKRFKDTVANMKNSPINVQEFNRIKKRIYGDYVREYNDTADIARMFLADFFKEINSFDYLEEITTINEEYVQQILTEIFDEKRMIVSVIKRK